MQFRIQGEEFTNEWEWIVPFPEKPEFQVEVKRPRFSELTFTWGRFALLREDARDIKGFQEYCVKNWFRDFKGATGADGQPLQNTEQIRTLMLEDVAVGLLTPLMSRYMTVGEADAEGKDVSVSG